MPILLTKTSQGQTRELRLVVTFARGNPGSLVVCLMQGYDPKWTDADGFLPVMSKVEPIEDPATVKTVQGAFPDNYPLCVSTVENYLLANVSWYAGGTIVP